MDKLNFSINDSHVRVVPTFEEKANTNKPYLYYGANNKFPQYLWELYLKSALLQSIINGTADYVMGDDIIYSESDNVQKLKDSANKDGDTLDDIVKKITIDYLIFGGFSIQVIFNKLGQISELYWLDFQNVRVNKDGNKIYYSDDWVKKSNDYLTYDVFDSNKRKGTSVFYFKGHLSRGIYPIPRYNGALSAIETSTEISKFHLNSILNNFSGNFIINFNNGQPSVDVQEEIERKVKEKFSGADNAGKFILSFNDSKDNGVTVERIADDNFDKKYESLRTDTYKEIFVAFRAIPQLFGLNLENVGFNTQEYESAYLLYNQTVIIPIQKDIIRIFNKIFGVDNSLSFAPFKLESKAMEAIQ